MTFSHVTTAEVVGIYGKLSNGKGNQYVGVGHFQILYNRRVNGVLSGSLRW